MMWVSRKNTVRGKLLFVVLVAAALALVTTGIAMAFYELRNFTQEQVEDLAAQADIVGLAAAPALQFEDPEAARDYLKLLHAKPGITSAAIYTASGSLFASYSADGQAVAFPKLPSVDGHSVGSDEIVLFKRIVADDEIVGTVGIKRHYDIAGRLIDYVGILAAVMLLSLAAAALIADRLQRTITGPMAAVTSVAHEVMQRRDFSLRAPKSTTDEIGLLVDAFNGMLNELGLRAQNLEESNQRLAQQVRERKRAENERSRGERRNRTLIRAITQLVWTSDSAGRFIEDQPGWAAYTGQSRDHYEGFGWRQGFDPVVRDTLEVAWVRASAEKEAFELELRLHHATSDAYRLINLRAVPVIAGNGSVIEWIGAITDIEDQRRNEADLRLLNAELEDRVSSRTAQLESANKELESFSYSVSHDLRAPLRAISGFSDLLWEDHKDSLDEEAQRKLGIIRGQAERMGCLIDDLLAFSRLGRKAIQPTQLNMSELAHNTFARLSNANECNGLEFHVGKLPPANGDRSLLEQVWVNLLSNAIKFSAKKDKPVVEVGAVVDAAENIYYVRDNGAGFDPRYQDKLFGVFQRLHNEAEFPGTGVGLALVHRIISRHGGRVWADSQIDDGATFHFSLPKENNDG